MSLPAQLWHCHLLILWCIGAASRHLTTSSACLLYPSKVGSEVVIVDICVVSAVDFSVVKLHMEMYKNVVVVPSGGGPAYSGAMRWGLLRQAHYANREGAESFWWCVRLCAWLKGEKGLSRREQPVRYGTCNAPLLGGAYCLRCGLLSGLSPIDWCLLFNVSQRTWPNLSALADVNLAGTLTLLIKMPAMVTFCRGHHRTLCCLPWIISQIIVCIGIVFR